MEFPGHRVNGAILRPMVVVDIKLVLLTVTVHALINPVLAHVQCKIVQVGLTSKSILSTNIFGPKDYLSPFITFFDNGLSKVPSLLI